jgi:DNA-binding MarR family transcriptional regulator
MEFLSKSKKIECINPDCKKNFALDQLQFLEFNNFKCNSCGYPVLVDSISDEIKSRIERIDEKKFLPIPELKIIRELEKADKPLYAREIAQEIDYSGQLVGWRGKKLQNEYDYVKRIKENDRNPYMYELTKKGRSYFDEIE